jgi:hypothetical protein
LDNEKLKLGITGWTLHNLQTSSGIVNKIADLQEVGSKRVDSRKQMADGRWQKAQIKSPVRKFAGREGGSRWIQYAISSRRPR